LGVLNNVPMCMTRLIMVLVILMTTQPLRLTLS